LLHYLRFPLARPKKKGLELIKHIEEQTIPNVMGEEQRKSHHKTMVN
jgi:hypothetical protein